MFLSRSRILRSRKKKLRRRNFDRLPFSCQKLKMPTSRPLESSKLRFSRRSNSSKRLLITTRRRLLEKKSSLLSKEESSRRRNSKPRDSESSRRRLRTDSPRLMLLEPRESSKSLKELLEIRNERKKSTDLRSSRRWKKPERSRPLRRRDSFLSRLDRREMSSSESSKSRRKLESEKLRSRMKRRISSSSTPSNLDLRSNRMMKL